jgi:hypothetical protein
VYAVHESPTVEKHDREKPWLFCGEGMACDLG